MPPPPPPSPRSSNADLPAAHFLKLPGELRNDIYRHYLRLEGGYVYNFQTATLTAHPDERRDVALQYTCKQVYEEMYGLALATNTLHFYPIESDDLRVPAARFQALCWLLDRRLETLVWPDHVFHPYFMVETDAWNGVLSREDYEEHVRAKRKRDYEIVHDDETNREEAYWIPWRGIDKDPRVRERHRDPEIPWETEIPLLTQSIIDEVAVTFPEMKRLLLLEPTALFHHVRGILSAWGTGYMTDTRLRAAIRHTVQVAIDRGCYTGDIAAYARSLLTLSSNHRRWDIPSVAQLDDMLLSLRACGALNTYDFEMGPWNTVFWESPGICPFEQQGEKQIFGKYRYSAAAAGVRFLEALPEKMRNHVRNMVLHENQTSVSSPQCHGLGFLPFFQENPMLSIERRIDLWRNVVQLVPDGEWWFQIVRHVYEPLRRSGAVKAVERWISETLALELSPASFSLVLEGDDGLDGCSEIFETLRLDAILMLAGDEALAQKPATDILLWRPEGLEPLDTFERWPDAVQAIVKGDSAVRCSFPTSKFSLPTVEDVMNIPRVRSQGAHELNHRTRRQLDWYLINPHPRYPLEPAKFEPPPSLPSWDKLQEENVIPEFFTSGERGSYFAR